MHEQEKLYEQYEDAVFALLMDKVAEENGKKLLQQNEELLADPDAAVPETLSKRCLRTIEKAYRKSQWKAAAKKVTRALNRVALWILVPLFLFGTAFAASETVRVKTLNFLITNFEFGTEFRIENTASATPQQQSMTPIVDDCIPSDYDLISQSSTSLFEKYLYANDSDSEVSIVFTHWKMPEEEPSQLIQRTLRSGITRSMIKASCTCRKQTPIRPSGRT